MSALCPPADSGVSMRPQVARSASRGDRRQGPPVETPCEREPASRAGGYAWRPVGTCLTSPPSPGGPVGSAHVLGSRESRSASPAVCPPFIPPPGGPGIRGVWRHAEIWGPRGGLHLSRRECAPWRGLVSHTWGGVYINLSYPHVPPGFWRLRASLGGIGMGTMALCNGIMIPNRVLGPLWAQVGGLDPLKPP